MGPDMNELEVEQIEERLRKSAIGHRPAAPSELLRFVDAVPVENRFAGRPTLIGHPHVRRSFAALATAAAVVVGLVGGVALVSLRTGGTAVSGGPDAAGWTWQRGDGTSVFQIGRVANGYVGRCGLTSGDGLCSSPDGANWMSPADPRIVVIDGAGPLIPQDIVRLGSVYLAINIDTASVALPGESSQAAQPTPVLATPTAMLATPTPAGAAQSPMVETVGPTDSLWRSADGLHWGRLGGVALDGLSPTAVGRIPGGFVLAAVASQDQPGWVLTSSDGITWTRASRMPVVATVTAAGSAVDGLWVSSTGGRESGVWWQTSDGATWAQMIMPAGVAQLDAAFTLGGEHVGMIVGPSTSGIVRSADGVTWKVDRGDLAEPAVTLCRMGDRLVAANRQDEGATSMSGSYVWQSDDGGLTWQPLLDPFGNQLVGLIQSAGDKLSIYSYTTNPADNTGSFHLEWLVSYGRAST
jgi:hypothetical protein